MPNPVPTFTLAIWKVHSGKISPLKVLSSLNTGSRRVRERRVAELPFPEFFTKNGLYVVLYTPSLQADSRSLKVPAVLNNTKANSVSPSCFLPKTWMGLYASRHILYVIEQECFHF